MVIVFRFRRILESGPGRDIAFDIEVVSGVRQIVKRVALQSLVAFGGGRDGRSTPVLIFRVLCHVR